MSVLNFYTNNYTTTLEPLQDRKQWKEKKEKSLYLGKMYLALDNISKYMRISECGSFLGFKRFVETGILKLHEANFCKVRLCPMCAWRRSLKMYHQMSRIMNYLTAQKENKYLFLTLTLENCKGEDLDKAITQLLKGYKKLSDYKDFKNTVKGWYRSMEVTYNQQKKTFHPHLHVVLEVPKTYFQHATMYITQKCWSGLWQNALDVDYTPIVDIRKCKTEGESVQHAIAELSKYTVKDSDFLLEDFGQACEVVNYLDKGLKGRRLIGYGGSFKDARKKLMLDDAEDGDLIHTDSDELREDLAYEIVNYGWFSGFSNYYKLN